MLSALNQSLYNSLNLPLYGVKAQAKSRNAALFFLFVFSTIFYLELRNIQPLAFTGQPIQPTTIIMRFMPHEFPLKEPELEKILADTSDFSIPEPPILEEPIPEEPEEEIEPKKEEPKPLPKAEIVPEPAEIAEDIIQKSVASQIPSTSIASTVINANEQALMLAALMKELEQNKRYPQNARRRGIEGTVYLLITMDSSGSVIAYELGDSNGENILEEATINLGEKMMGFATNINTGKTSQLRVPIRYSLEDM